MRKNVHPERPRLEEHSDPPAGTEGTGEGQPVAKEMGEALAPATIALATGGVVLAVAVAWGAAEAAVAVGAAYLVYSAITMRGDLSGPLAVRLLTGVLRRQPAEAPVKPRAE
jgi:hypothetical protein